MNGATKEIAKLLGASIARAESVQSMMEESGLDFSECTQREFNRAAREAEVELKNRNAEAILAQIIFG